VHLLCINHNRFSSLFLVSTDNRWNFINIHYL
jgi:hypothetical protein